MAHDGKFCSDISFKSESLSDPLFLVMSRDKEKANALRPRFSLDLFPASANPTLAAYMAYQGHALTRSRLTTSMMHLTFSEKDVIYSPWKSE